MLIAAAAASSGGVETFYYVLGSIAVVTGGVLGFWRILRRQKQRWTDEGSSRAEQAQAIKDNNTKLDRNTDAIARLTSRMDDFVTTVHSELNGLGNRITRLEFFHAQRQGKSNQ